jgi:unsaturated rhamnogalacturonyl hydrolase
LEEHYDMNDRLWALGFGLLSVAALGAFAQTPPGDRLDNKSVYTELQRIAALSGEPHAVAAGGLTRSEQPLHTIENASASSPGPQRRVVMVAGLDGDARGAHAALGAVNWFKTKAPDSLRRAWSVSAMPLADPDQRSHVRAFQFPPEKGFFDDPDQPESRYVWRWANYQTPDLIVEIRGGDAIGWQTSGVPALKAGELSSDAFAAAIARRSELGATPALAVTAGAGDGPQLLQRALEAANALPRSGIHATIASRVDRKPIDLARVLAGKYPQNPIVSYIPSVAWMNTLRLAAATKDDSLRTKVLHQVDPWLSGKQKLFGDRPSLTAAAGTMIYAELAESGVEPARALAVQGAEAAAAPGANGIAQYGQGWTDDMFMTASVLARTGKMPGRGADLDRSASLLIAYAGRLQRQDGIFSHFTDGQRAPWGRGNGFAALGLTELLTSLPPSHSLRANVLEIYLRQMAGLKGQQSPDGTWRQVIDEPGAYREESATAMILTAMVRGLRLGWLDPSYRPVVDRAWRALAAHVTETGDIVDICTSTGAGPTRRYYFDRAAIDGPDDRGGAMALLASMEMNELLSH